MDTKTHVKYWIGITTVSVLFLLYADFMIRRHVKILKTCEDVVNYRNSQDDVDYNNLYKNENKDIIMCINDNDKN